MACRSDPHHVGTVVSSLGYGRHAWRITPSNGHWGFALGKIAAFAGSDRGADL
ncbi:hypothetical protein GOD57_26520 [Sinorhizobium medicae]|nr:hypothetical protein [Sinorhizobium medicae]